MFADSCISMETEGLMDLLRDVERSRDQKLRQPGNFVVGRMYDKSPFTMRTGTLSEDGHSEGDVSTAKAMGAQLRFAFTCFTSNNGSEQSPRAHIIRGALSSRLTSVTSLHAPKVLQALRSAMSLPPEVCRNVEDLFPRRGVAINADLHPSNNAAERQERMDKPRWPSAVWRCSFHRARTAEPRALALDSPTESFLFNVGLAFFSTPGAWKAFKGRLLGWAESKLRMHHGPIPR